VYVVKSIIDDKLPINVEINDEIFVTSDCFATFVGYEYGDTKNGLLLFDINILAF
jgi:hypothetical protein